MIRSAPAACGVALALGALAACGGGPAAPSVTTPAPAVPTAAACSGLGDAVSASTSIVNGADCPAANTSVVLLNLKDSGGLQIGSCTGSVIAARAILTAAHCLHGQTATVNVFAGSGPQQVTTTFAAHPSWRENNSTAYDVGVVLMSGDIGRAPIPLLLSRDARVGETAILSGWGKDAAGVPSILRAGSATITAVLPLTLQTTYTTAAASVCQGDSGGPLLLQESGAWAIAGVISANSTLACSFGDNFYANLRQSEIASFILGKVPDAGSR
jgi:hypothetical protein